MKLEKDKADMSFALQRAGIDKDQEIVAAKAAASIAENKLQSLLEELSNAKHTSEAASTTSGLVLKVCFSVCWPCLNRWNTFTFAGGTCMWVNRLTLVNRLLLLLLLL